MRALERVECDLPALATELFGGAVAPPLRAQGVRAVDAHGLVFNQHEPAVNIYNVGNGFEPHKDLHALTLLVPLVAPVSAFEGGGTAFWASPPAPHGAYFGARHTWSKGTRSTEYSDWLPDAKGVAPSLVMREPAGTALIFGGDVTHGGQPVTSGQRTVFVASFSRVAHRPMALPLAA
jgi:hypothetical protein